MPADRARVPVLAIDGPGGAGKGTVSCAVAERLGWHLLDSGALYRLLAYEAMRNERPLDDADAMAGIAAGLDVAFVVADGGVRVRLHDRDVSDAIRSEAVSRAASVIAAQPAVREALVARQRQFRRPPGLVADGRDMGSVIFPDAGLKIFLTASVEERARRRHKQLKDKGIDVSLSALSSDMAARDRRDTERSVAPLKASQDAVILDTTDMGIDEVVSSVLSRAAKTWSLAGDF